VIEREDQDALLQIVGPSGAVSSSRPNRETRVSFGVDSRRPTRRVVVGFDLSFRRSDLTPFRRLAIAQLAAIFPEYEVCDFGHIAEGSVHFNLVPRASTDDNPSWIAALRDHVVEMAVRNFGASFSGGHGIGRTNQAAYDELTPVAVQKYSAAVAAVLRAYRRLRCASGRRNARRGA
jgi:FAD/FMN-containing dehydrogenase